MTLDDLLYTKSHGVARITFNRPDKLNALANTTTQQLCYACHDAIADPEVRVLLLTGAGGAFSAGGDYKDTFVRWSEKSAEEWRARIRSGPNELVRILEKSEKPVVASIDGVAIGGGATIALACDIRIASDRSRFGFPFSKIGVTSEFGCSYLLPRVVGLSKAFELLFFAEIIDANEAYKIGLVNFIVPQRDLESKTQDLLERLIEKPPGSLGTIKTLLYRSLSADLDSMLELEALAISAAFKTTAHRDAVRRFLHRRSEDRKVR